MGTLSGEATHIFILAFCLPSNESTPKEKKLLLKEQNLPFKSGPLLEEFHPPEKQTGSHKSCFPS